MARFAGRVDELIAWIRDQGRTGIGDQRDRLIGRETGKQLRTGFCRVVFVIGCERRGDSIAVHELTGYTGILTCNDIGAS
jgi:hypothetical protein